MKRSRKNILPDLLPDNFINVIRFTGFYSGIAVSFFTLILFIAALFRHSGGLFLSDSVLGFFAFILLLLTGSGLMFHLRRRFGQVKVLYFILPGFIAPFPYFIIYTYIILLLDFVFFPPKDNHLKDNQVPESSEEPPVSAVSAVKIEKNAAGENSNENSNGNSDEDEREIWDESITQQLSRRKTADGSESVEGTILAEFEDKQLTAAVHIPFCPPFERVPEVEVYLLEEADAAVSVASSEVFGVRFEVKRKKNSEIKTVRFAFAAGIQS